MNAYWDEVRPYVADGVVRRTDLDPGNREAWRERCRSAYAMTISDPGTVVFVAEHLGWKSDDAGPHAFDPMAGTGWWAHVLAGTSGIHVYCSDTNVPAGHWSTVTFGDADLAAEDFSRPAEPIPMLLSWPPRHHDIGERAIRAYRGSRIVHMGAEGRTSDGTDEMRRILRTEWTQIDQHIPVRWPGVKDLVTVYERRT